MPSDERVHNATLAQRILAPETLWDRGMRYGLFSWAVIGILILLFLLWRYAAIPLRIIFAPVAIALAVVYILNPLTTRLQRYMRRGFAVTIVYLSFVIVAGAGLSFLIPAIVHQVQAFFDNLPGYLEQTVNWVNDLAAKRKSEYRIKVTSQDIINWVQGNRESIISFLGGVRSFAGSVVHGFVTVLLGIVLSIYVLLDLPKAQAKVRGWIPERHREDSARLGQAVGMALGGFFRGQLLIASFVGILSGIGLTLADVPFAILWGLTLGVFQLIPMVGIFLGSIPVTLVAILSGGWQRGVWAIVVIVVVQQIDNHIFSPNILRRTVQLHPVTVMLSLLVGSALAGIFGMLLVIPLVAAVKAAAAILWRHDRVQEALGPALGVDGEPDGA